MGKMSREKCLIRIKESEIELGLRPPEEPAPSMEGVPSDEGEPVPEEVPEEPAEAEPVEEDIEEIPEDSVIDELDQLIDEPLDGEADDEEIAEISEESLDDAIEELIEEPVDEEISDESMVDELDDLIEEPPKEEEWDMGVVGGAGEVPEDELTDEEKQLRHELEDVHLAADDEDADSPSPEEMDVPPPPEDEETEEPQPPEDETAEEEPVEAPDEAPEEEAPPDEDGPPDEDVPSEEGGEPDEEIEEDEDDIEDLELDGTPTRWKPLSNKGKKEAKKALLRFKKGLDKLYKRGELTREECAAKVKEMEVELGLIPPPEPVEELPGPPAEEIPHEEVEPIVDEVLGDVPIEEQILESPEELEEETEEAVETKVCQSCGAAVPADSETCGLCGSVIEETEQIPDEVAPPPEEEPPEEYVEPEEPPLPEEPIPEEEPPPPEEEVPSKERMVADSLEVFMKIPGVGPFKAGILYEAGFRTVEELHEAGVEELAQIKNIGHKSAVLIIKSVEDMLVPEEPAEVAEIEIPEIVREEIEEEVLDVEDDVAELKVKKGLLIVGTLMCLVGVFGVVGLRLNFIQHYIFGDPTPYPGIGYVEPSGHIVSLIPFIIGLIVLIYWGFKNDPIYHEIEKLKEEKEELEKQLGEEIPVAPPEEPPKEEPPEEELAEEPEPAKYVAPPEADLPEPEKLESEEDQERIRYAERMMDKAFVLPGDRERLRFLIQTGISKKDFTQEVKKAVEKRKAEEELVDELTELEESDDDEFDVDDIIHEIEEMEEF
jgi:ribosomal protein L40E